MKSWLEMTTNMDKVEITHRKRNDMSCWEKMHSGSFKMEANIIIEQLCKT